MSEEQELAARGRILTEYGEVKTRLASLLAESNRAGKELSNLGRALIQSPETVKIGGQPFVIAPGQPQKFAREFLDAEKLIQLVTDIRKTKSAVSQLEAKLKEFGL